MVETVLLAILVLGLGKKGIPLAQPESHIPVVDVVYTWVDTSDAKWAAAQQAHKFRGSSPTQSLDNAGEILISLASLEARWPWVGKIHIATAFNQSFKLHSLSQQLQQKISFVDHTDFIPKEFLPTFSAPAIEAHLHRIPGLSEHFIYQNDDFFACPLTAADAFAAGPKGVHVQKFKVFALHAPLFYRTRACTDSKLWAFSLCNTKTAFLRRLPQAVFPNVFWHGAYFLTKQAYKHTWRVFASEMHRVSAHRFRLYRANVQPITLVMNMAVSQGYQQPDFVHRFNGYGVRKQRAFVEDMAKGFDEKGYCQQNAITFFHQALTKSSKDVALSFCHAAFSAFSAGLNQTADKCFCAATPFASKCT
ncbi:hypothetical protein DUNSADRAFT_15590 [Dunaliella salina]|uniref:Stealth protein CR2 conserved region 2 domain-containing protein n=1 Tax=Dunaliella salina TaxID=3046 RepID=A0ABQ7G532_DUNSA|nr:hypothetical protein DUNSADRAFT_15590 [Dunaliella salina]|eukprot:KAF5829710.1 hypothetical protein DUNSADRAFT_15590 [Dunaliella salina]